MQIAADELNNFLAKNEPRVFLVHGDEPLQAIESVAAIRAKLETLGYTEVGILDNKYGENIWEELLTSLDNLDLFASRKIIELRLAGVKLGRDGGKILLNFINNLPSNIAFILVSEKLSTRELKSAWSNAINSNGVVVAANNIPKYQLPAWIKKRLAQYKLNVANDAIDLLAHHFEGNILSLAQTITKLKLFYKDSSKELSSQDISNFLINATKFSVFDFTNALLQNDAKRSFHILESLKANNAEPGLLLWAVTREIKNLEKIETKVQAGGDMQAAARKLGIWSSQLSPIRNTLNRLTKSNIIKLLQLLTTLDIINKNIIPGNFWDNLQSFCLKFFNPSLLNLEEASL